MGLIYNQAFGFEITLFDLVTFASYKYDVLNPFI